MAAALAAGADAVRIGTRFAAARESAAHPDYVEALLRAAGEDTVLTEAFGVDWPDAPHRVLRSCLEAAEAADEDGVRRARRGRPGNPDGEVGLGAALDERAWPSRGDGPVRRRGVGAVQRVQPAAEIMAELVGEAETLLARLG